VNESSAKAHLSELRANIARLEKVLGRRPKLLVAEVGLEGYSQRAEQLALHARDAGFEVVYLGERAQVERLVAAAIEEDVHAVGLAMPASCAPQLEQLAQGLRAAGSGDLPIVLGEAATRAVPVDVLARLLAALTRRAGVADAGPAATLPLS